MQEACARLLEAGGFRQYEISAWAAGDRQCRHNLNYWRFGDYLGIGAGAHGKLTDAGAGEVRRTARVRHPRRYLAGEPMVNARRKSYGRISCAWWCAMMAAASMRRM